MEAGLGLLIVALLVFAKSLFERTHFGHSLALTTYDYLQSILESDYSPVVVVDTSALQWERHHRVRDRIVTDRLALKSLVDGIAEQGPCGVGIDIDFSPNWDADGSWEFHDPENDSALFDACLMHSENGVPVFLGVDRSVVGREGKSNEWLGKPRYRRLAAGVRAPMDDNRMMVESMEFVDSEVLISLGAALGRVFPADRRPQGLWRPPSWFAQRAEGFHWSTEGIRMKDVYVDTSALDKIRTVTAEEVLATKTELRGKLILIGGPLDEKVSIAGLRRTAIPGVYLHAAAAHTLATAPIYVLTLPGRILIDLALSVTVLGALVVYRLRCVRRAAVALESEKLQRRATRIVMALALFVGVLSINSVRIMWDDFLMVFVALALHAPVERFVHWIRQPSA
jgi:CHASE2 domain-containing sensor protein